MTRRLALLPLVVALGATGCGGKSAGAPGGCKEVDQPPTRSPGPRPPLRALQPGKKYVVTLTTSCGDIAIRLDVKDSPTTAASFVSLVQSGFYDKTPFHRIIPRSVVQGGDPTGTGNGGPGYTTRDKPPRGTRYTRGVVAMAKTARQPAGTGGSQFFIVSGRAIGLPPVYALLGRVVKGISVVKRIDAIGDPGSGEAGTPLRPVVLERAKVHVS